MEIGVIGVFFFDVVCFVFKVLDICLLDLYVYMFYLILFFFGKDIELNMCILIIFVDGVKLFVIFFLIEVNFLFGNIFCFNILVLFVENEINIYFFL